MPDPALDYTTGTITWKAIAGQDAIHYVAQSGGATGGNYTLVYEHPAVSVGTIAYNANIATIQTAFDAAFGASETVVSGVDATSFTVEFSGPTYGKTQIDYQSLTNALTGGSSPTVTVTVTQVGRPDQTAPLLDLQDVDGNTLVDVIAGFLGYSVGLRVHGATDGTVGRGVIEVDVESDSTFHDAFFKGVAQDSVGGAGVTWVLDASVLDNGNSAGARMLITDAAAQFWWQTDRDTNSAVLTLTPFAAQTTAVLDVQDGTTAHLIEATGDAKLGFYNKAPVALQTGVAVSAAGIHAALVNLGLITA